MTIVSGKEKKKKPIKKRVHHCDSNAINNQRDMIELCSKYKEMATKLSLVEGVKSQSQKHLVVRWRSKRTGVGVEAEGGRT